MSHQLTLGAEMPTPDKRYFLLAVAIHLAILAYPLQRVVRQLDLPPLGPITVNLETPPSVLPMQPEAPPKLTPTSAQPERVKPTPKRPEIIAVTPEMAAPSAATVAPPVPVVPVTAAAVAGNPTPAPALPLVQARFDAAYLQNPKPAYPALSRRLGEQGKVQLRVRVGVQGQALSVDLAQGSGFERLDEAALQAVNRWRFVPAKRGDEAVEAMVIVPVVFRLDD